MCGAVQGGDEATKEVPRVIPGEVLYMYTDKVKENSGRHVDSSLAGDSTRREDQPGPCCQVAP